MCFVLFLFNKKIIIEPVSYQMLAIIMHEEDVNCSFHVSAYAIINWNNVAMTVKITWTHWDIMETGKRKILFAFDGNGIFTLFFACILSVYQIGFEANGVSLSLSLILFRFYLKHDIRKTSFRIITLSLNNINSRLLNQERNIVTFFNTELPYFYMY